MKSPYEILGVGTDASAQDISSAYRKRALLHHPDRNPGNKQAEAKFREATEAYTILSDPAKRVEYDAKTAEQDDGPGPGSPDFFNDMWGTGFGGRGPFNRARHSGKDIEHEITLSVEESVLGATKVISFKDGEDVQCRRCLGRRAEPGTRKMPCTHCAGSGRSFFNPMHGGTTRCDPCKGQGDIPVRKCTACDGEGTEKAVREFQVKIPAGIASGQRLRLAGKGEPGHGGPPGDMYVTVKLAEGGKFTRRGNDLHTVVRAPFHVAASHHGTLKTSFHVRGVDGREHKLDLSVFRPGDTQFIIRGAGVGGMGGERGNLHVVVMVDMPEAKTPRAAALLRELVDELSPPPVTRWTPPSPDDD